MTYTFPEILRGTPEYAEVTRFLGGYRLFVADESVRQINHRWLKGTVFVKDENGQHMLADDGETLITKRRRIRIPRDSFLAKP
jgi:hypothetical protein